MSRRWSRIWLFVGATAVLFGGIGHPAADAHIYEPSPNPAVATVTQNPVTVSVPIGFSDKNRNRISWNGSLVVDYQLLIAVPDTVTIDSSALSFDGSGALACHIDAGELDEGSRLFDTSVPVSDSTPALAYSESGMNVYELNATFGPFPAFRTDEGNDWNRHLVSTCWNPVFNFDATVSEAALAPGRLRADIPYFIVETTPVKREPNAPLSQTGIPQQLCQEDGGHYGQAAPVTADDLIADPAAAPQLFQDLFADTEFWTEYQQTWRSRYYIVRPTIRRGLGCVGEGTLQYQKVPGESMNAILWVSAGSGDSVSDPAISTPADCPGEDPTLLTAYGLVPTLDDPTAYSRYPCVEEATPGETVEFAFGIRNDGDSHADRIVWYDILPHLGDTDTVGGGFARGTTGTRLELISDPVIQGLPEGATTELQYSASTNPCRAEVTESVLSMPAPATPLPAGCVEDWTSDRASLTGPVAALRLDISYNSDFATTGADQEVLIEWSMQLPDEVGNRDIFWNSAGWTATELEHPDWTYAPVDIKMLAAEPLKVGVVADAPPPTTSTIPPSSSTAPGAVSTTTTPAVMPAPPGDPDDSFTLTAGVDQTVLASAGDERVFEPTAINTGDATILAATGLSTGWLAWVGIAAVFIGAALAGGERIERRQAR